MLKIIIIILAAIIAGLLAAILYGTYRWDAGTKDLRARLDAARMPVHPAAVDFRELNGLPAPVQRYFRLALKKGQPMVAGVRVRHSGSFNTGKTADKWKPFSSEQMVITKRPGFDWNGSIMVIPGVPIRVHDAYVAGEGLLHASLFGIVSLADLSGTGEIARGELMRFFRGSRLVSNGAAAQPGGAMGSG